MQFYDSAVGVVTRGMLWAADAEPTESPSPALDTSSTAVTAGLGGFFVLFGLALVLWFIARDMAKRMRGINQREQLRLRERARVEQETSAAGKDEDDLHSTRPRGARDVKDIGDIEDDYDDGRDPLA